MFWNNKACKICCCEIGCLISQQTCLEKLLFWIRMGSYFSFDNNFKLTKIDERPKGK